MKRFLRRRPWRRLITLMLLSVLSAGLLSLLPIEGQFPFLPAQPEALTITEPSTGITVHVNSGGAYTITTRQPAWTFGGQVGSALSSLSLSGGIDSVSMQI